MKAFHFIVAALFYLGIAGGVMASERPDFSGVWVLNLDKSDSVDAILKAQGRSWPERKIADSITVTQTITQTPELMTVHITSSVTDRVDRLKLDGTTETKETDRLGTVKTRTFWSDDGKILTSVTTMTLSDGTKADMHAIRHLTPEGALRQDIELHLADGKILKAKRHLDKSSQ